MCGVLVYLVARFAITGPCPVYAFFVRIFVSLVRILLSVCAALAAPSTHCVNLHDVNTVAIIHVALTTCSFPFPSHATMLPALGEITINLPQLAESISEGEVGSLNVGMLLFSLSVCVWFFIPDARLCGISHHRTPPVHYLISRSPVLYPHEAY